MGWCRSKARFGACLALAALALNLVVAFDQHSFGDIAAHSHAAIEQAGAGAPTDHHDDDDHGDPLAAHPCFACLVVTAAALAATPPALPERGATQTTVIATAAPFPALHSGRTSFDARAPPHG